MSEIPNRFNLVVLCAVVGVSLALSASASATAIATSAIQLESLVITLSGGSFVGSPSAGVTVTAFNNLGEMGNASQYGTTAVSASTAITFASASGFLDPVAQTASVSSQVIFPAGSNGAALSYLYSYVDSLPFTITGTTGPVTAEFTATFLYQQSLMTDSLAPFATSQATVYLILANITTLSEESDNTIGPSSSWASNGTWVLDTSQTLMAGQQYELLLDLNTWTQAQVVPEPTTISLLVTGVLVPLVRGRLRTNRLPAKREG